MSSRPVLKGPFAPLWVVAAALEVELEDAGLVKVRSVKCEVVLGEPSEDLAKLCQRGSS